jgi:predicted HTH transcriptional regulator
MLELGSVMRVVFYPHPEASEELIDNVPVNVPVNQRQQWFISQIQKNVMVSAKDIAGHWKVSEKTAKRDITDLKQKRVIAFSGAAKNGSYYLLG